ncbi:MAG TPA: ribosome-associated translation inhibitor RaiA [Oligoflexia bacterium]|nr:ribosome-associated translation inhibitor RaiA [Oligoflexia bacterium]HMP49081.1 ribosome-associated translation inhibitor RaiA [Oligoflexia bacterium]
MGNLKTPELNVSVTFRHTDPTEALKKYSTDKVIQRVSKYFHSSGDIRIVLSVEKMDHLVEVHLVGKGIDLVAKATTEDLYSSIDKVVDILEGQLRKQKDKVVKSHRSHIPEPLGA